MDIWETTHCKVHILLCCKLSSVDTQGTQIKNNTIGIFFAWESYVFPYIFYQEYHVDYKTSKIGKINAY